MHKCKLKGFTLTWYLRSVQSIDQIYFYLYVMVYKQKLEKIGRGKIRDNGKKEKK